MGANSNMSSNMCENYSIKAKPTTSHNPQANSIIEQVHKVINTMLRSFDLEKENLEEDNPFEYFLQSTAWAIRSTYHTALSCQLVFGRDNIACKANWDQIQKSTVVIIVPESQITKGICIPKCK
jgi:hypothetical protein